MGIQIGRAAQLRHRQRQGLVVIVGQDMGGDIVGHGSEQGIALLLVHLAPHHRPAEQDLEIDFVIGGVDAGAVVHRVGIDARAGSRHFDAAQLRDPQIGAFAHHLGPHLIAVDAQARHWRGRPPPDGTATKP